MFITSSNNNVDNMAPTTEEILSYYVTDRISLVLYMHAKEKEEVYIEYLATRIPCYCRTVS